MKYLAMFEKESDANGWFTDWMPPEHLNGQGRSSETVMVTIEIAGKRYIDNGRTVNGDWHCDCSRLIGYQPKVVAWQPFPNPYEDESEE